MTEPTKRFDYDIPIFERVCEKLFATRLGTYKIYIGKKT